MKYYNIIEGDGESLRIARLGKKKICGTLIGNDRLTLLKHAFKYLYEIFTSEQNVATVKDLLAGKEFINWMTRYDQLSADCNLFGKKCKVSLVLFAEAIEDTQTKEDV